MCANGSRSWRVLRRPAIHSPWKASSDVLARAEVVLGKTYPKPIVDHAAARSRALAAFADMRDAR